MYSTVRVSLIGVALLTCCVVQRLYADVRLPKLIGEGMVLQQGVAVPLWGWADEGERVTVSIQGQSVSATTAGGKWSANLQPLKSGGPFPLKIVGKNTIKFKNVLVGEVWVSCGQSNMMMSLASVEGGTEALAASSKYPLVRVFNVSGDEKAAQPRDDVQGAWGPVSGGFSAVSYFFGRALNEKLSVPMGLINAVTVVPAEAWVDAETLAKDPFLSELANSPLGLTSKSYNGFIAPLQPYAIRGAIYYQGEYNVGRGREFQRLFPALIHSWRKTWGQGDFPFLFVQLTAFSEHKAPQDKKLDMPAAELAALHKPGIDSAWAELRDAQLQTLLSVPETAMAVTIDLGDPQDIHPRFKQPIGERLARAARAIAYGEKLVYSGPVFKRVEVVGEKLRLHFDHVGTGLLAREGALRGFELGRPDGTFVFSESIIDGPTVTVSHADIPQPTAVRYAWADYPNGNLFNAEGLPASPFRARVPGRSFAADKFTIEWRNPSFEPAGTDSTAPADWTLKDGAEPCAEKSSAGKQSLRLPVGGGAIQDNIVAGSVNRCDWNSDPLSRQTFRPGSVVGYSVDLATSAGGTGATAYLRLCGNSSATGISYFGGVPTVLVNHESFTTYPIATCLSQTFDLDGRGMGVGVLFACQPASPSGVLYLDNLSTITVLRPMLAVSNSKPLEFGAVKIGDSRSSPPRHVFNTQKQTLPDCREAAAEPRQVATVLHGVCNLKSAPQWGIEHVWGPADDVGCMLIGPQAKHFEFVSGNRGKSPQELRFIGQDDKPGLLGGPIPETEEAVVRFLGSAEPGIYTATLRIVSQAANVGTVSTGREDEPLENLFYVDIPVSAQVVP